MQAKAALLKSLQTKHLAEVRQITERFGEFERLTNRQISSLQQEKTGLEQEQASKDDQINRLKQASRSTSQHYDKTLKTCREKVERLEGQLKKKEEEGKKQRGRIAKQKEQLAQLEATTKKPIQLVLHPNAGGSAAHESLRSSACADTISHASLLRTLKNESVVPYPTAHPAADAGWQQFSGEQKAPTKTVGTQDEADVERTQTTRRVLQEESLGDYVPGQKPASSAS